MPDESTQKEQLYEFLVAAIEFTERALVEVELVVGPNLTKADCAEVWLPLRQAIRKLQEVCNQVEPVKVVT